MRTFRDGHLIPTTFGRSRSPHILHPSSTGAGMADAAVDAHRPNSATIKSVVASRDWSCRFGVALRFVLFFPFMDTLVVPGVDVTDFDRSRRIAWIDAPSLDRPA